MIMRRTHVHFNVPPRNDSQSDPPRKLIRKDAPLELPHILVLISDPEKTVIEPLSNAKNSLEFVYETA